ncbi:MAG: DUF86 domain-containing protein [Bacteroidales bacterium]|nr:DUF86 domain-containing protein [Bacteroidales bacterium]
MREQIKDKGRLEHILTSIELLMQDAFSIERGKLTEDRLKYYGIVKSLEIIGEASYMLSPQFKEAHPETPWREIIALRHVLVHGYFNIQSDEVWNILHSDIPALRQQVKAYLEA